MIPQVTNDAIEESFKKMTMSIKELYNLASDERVKAAILKFKEEQPDIFKNLADMMTFHYHNTEGMITIHQVVLYVIILMNSIYIQEEINDCKKLFDTDPFKNNEDDIKLEDDEKKEDDEENPEDYLW